MTVQKLTLTPSHPCSCSDKPLLPSRRPTPLDKRILLWARRYKSFDDIPEVVSFQMINTAKNRLRVKIAYIMMVLTIIGCFIMITSGKKILMNRIGFTRIFLLPCASQQLWMQKEQSTRAKTNQLFFSGQDPRVN
uniref:Family with sequence similarity 162 member A n=1 Tax=Eptatretus burgeri TaxID=7764 RepID=A0A8C4QJ76_EPTBU